MRDLPPSPATRLMPTSITVAPGLIQSRRTISALPTAANTTSARRQTAGKIAGPGMRDRHRRVLRKQQLRERLADDVGAADHHRFEPVERGHARSSPGARSRAACRARAPAARPTSRPAFTGWKPSTSLPGSIAAITFLRIDLRRQRQLHQDAVHGRSALSRADEPAVRLRWSRRQAVIERAHAASGGHLHLAADIDLARRIVADQHDREPRHDAAVARQPAHRVRHLAAQVGCDRLAVDDVCGHARHDSSRAETSG